MEKWDNDRYYNNDKDDNYDSNNDKDNSDDDNNDDDDDDVIMILQIKVDITCFYLILNERLGTVAAELDAGLLGQY